MTLRERAKKCPNSGGGGLRRGRGLGVLCEG
jgi:hypothetical protein